MKKIANKYTAIICIVLCVICALTVCLAACGESKEEETIPTEQEAFVIADATSVADIIYDADDYKQIIRAVGDLQSDIAAVSGKTPEIKTEKSSKKAVIIGSADSALIKAVYDNGKLPELDKIRGNWESYIIKEVESPVAGVDSALVVAGSDKRGTIYGLYTISESIGVSPWYWWADVPVRMQSVVAWDTPTIVSNEPDVKYRGIFLNDEMNLTTWAKAFANGTGSPNDEVYGRFFELLLRLKANSLWPAMHGVSEGFYVRKDENGKSVNAEVADDYGIVIGTSHCEQCMRNNVAEWTPWLMANSGKYGLPDTTSFSSAQCTAAYDFSVYPEAVTQYWRESLENTKDY